jgi:hypothetical protein
MRLFLGVIGFAIWATLAVVIGTGAHIAPVWFVTCMAALLALGSLDEIWVAIKESLENKCRSRAIQGEEESKTSRLREVKK